jgi:hypothetical protein
MISSCSATRRCRWRFFICWTAPAGCSYARWGRSATLPPAACIRPRVH